jgi:diguanylate cyclase (GGDEF)-like protein
MDYENMDKSQLINLLREKDNLIKSLADEKAQISYYATVDDMTGLLNRYAGLDLLRKNFETMKRYGGSLTICFIDINGLKRVNDELGHEEGDKLIVNVAQIITESIRKADIAFRLGGDEFVIAFPHTTIQTANNVWERMCHKISEINKSAANRYKISLSHGLSEHSSDNHVTIEHLIQVADLEMYKEKRLSKEISLCLIS